MNHRYVVAQVALLHMVLSAILLAMAGAFIGGHVFVTEYAVDQYEIRALLYSGGGGLTLSGAIWLMTRRSTARLRKREALFLVALSWILGGAFAAIPFYVWSHIDPAAGADHPFNQYTDCFFEAMSGLTTAGSSILTDIESLPHGLLLWRSTLQWLGGVGIVVLFVAVLPSLGAGGRRLFGAETSGLSKGGLHPHIRDTARVLWYIYASLTIIQIAFLRLLGMGWFDATNHAFCTMATGGYSTRNASVGHFDSGAIQFTIIAFMVLGSINFHLYHRAIKGKWREVLADVELRIFLIMLAIASLIVIASLFIADNPIQTSAGDLVDPTASNAVRYGVFQTVSRSSTTGFANADDNPWPFPARAALFALMFVGGCAGSTSGGIKVGRIWIMLKILISQIERAFRPSVVRPMRLGKSTIGLETRLAVLAFVLATAAIWALGSTALTLLELSNSAVEMDFTTASSATIAVFSTVGPGFSHVGSVQNYAWFSPAGKLLLCAVMLIGRLEIFTILALFTPRFWSED